MITYPKILEVLSSLVKISLTTLSTLILALLILPSFALSNPQDGGRSIEGQRVTLDGLGRQGGRADWINPVMPITSYSFMSNSDSVSFTPVTGDINADGVMEVFVQNGQFLSVMKYNASSGKLDYLFSYNLNTNVKTTPFVYQEGGQVRIYTLSYTSGQVFLYEFTCNASGFTYVNSWNAVLSGSRMNSQIACTKDMNDGENHCFFTSSKHFTMASSNHGFFYLYDFKTGDGNITKTTIDLGHEYSSSNNYDLGLLMKVVDLDNDGFAELAFMTSRHYVTWPEVRTALVFVSKMNESYDVNTNLTFSVGISSLGSSAFFSDIYVGNLDGDGSDGKEIALAYSKYASGSTSYIGVYVARYDGYAGLDLVWIPTFSPVQLKYNGFLYKQLFQCPSIGDFIAGYNQACFAYATNSTSAGVAAFTRDADWKNLTEADAYEVLQGYSFTPQNNLDKVNGLTFSQAHFGSANNYRPSVGGVLLRGGGSSRSYYRVTSANSTFGSLMADLANDGTPELLVWGRDYLEVRSVPKSNQNAVIVSATSNTGFPVCNGSLFTYSLKVSDAEFDEVACSLNVRFSNGTLVYDEGFSMGSSTPATFTYTIDVMGAPANFYANFTCKDTYHSTTTGFITPFRTQYGGGCFSFGSNPTTIYTNGTTVIEGDISEAINEGLDKMHVSGSTKFIYYLIIMLIIAFCTATHGMMVVISIEILFLILGWTFGLIPLYTLILVSIICAAIIVYKVMNK